WHYALDAAGGEIVEAEAAAGARAGRGSGPEAPFDPRMKAAHIGRPQEDRGSDRHARIPHAARQPVPQHQYEPEHRQAPVIGEALFEAEFARHQPADELAAPG